MVVSELRLRREPTAASAQATVELAQAVDAWTGPGVLVFNGGTIELLSPDASGRQPGDHPGDAQAALSAHPRLLASVQAFAAGAGRKVVYLPGSHDGRATWDPAVIDVVRRQIGAEVALALDLRIDTGAGSRSVRVEPGHRLDPLTCPGDARNPADSPLGDHLVAEILPALRASRGDAPADAGWLSGLEELDDPAAFPRFLASRLAYRRVGRHAWWLLLPILLAVVLRLPVAFLQRAHSHVASVSQIVLFVAIATLVEVIIVGLVAAVVVRRTWQALAGVALSRDAGDDPNEEPRAAARDRVTAGQSGLITGHTRHPELTHLGTGFYANAGGASEVVAETPSRLASLGMPSLFLAHRQVAWVELEAGNELHVRLLHAGQDLPGATAVEKLLARRSATGVCGGELRPTIVASFPQGDSWPAAVDPTPRLRRVRRLSASLVAAAGVISLVSSFYQPIRTRLRVLLKLIPIVVPQAANALVALGAVALLLLARGIRRGQRRAWVICEGLLLVTAVLHLVKGFDAEEALLAVGVAFFLFYHRSAFNAGADRPSTRRAATMIVGGAVVAVLAGTLGVELGSLVSRSRHHRRIPLPRALQAAAERMVGIHHVVLPDRLDDFFTPAMVTVTVGLVAAAAYFFFRPVVARRGAAHANEDGGLVRAREIVARFGSGTLDYFALRSDKQYFFWGDTMVAHAVYGGVCLVSPDPVGPVPEREEAWKAFRRFADSRGWALAVLGAGEDWLPIYRSSGMHDLYVGDEAVVDCRRFTLEGGRYKGLRQAVNRIAKYGYTITFHTPGDLTPELRGELESVMTQSRRGDVERGFSMTLGRAFDPADAGLLLAVVHGVDGHAVAFIQYVPAPGIDGYSLDLMRRDDGDHPNGLMDFAIVETLRWLAQHDRRGLGLNFATMRAVLAGEAGPGLSQRIQGWLLRRMSDSMQIESLWKFNAKYDPDWQPRYAIYDSPEHALPTAMAVARAESFWELPLIGRFLVPSPEPACPAAAKPATAEPGAPAEAAVPEPA